MIEPLRLSSEAVQPLQINKVLFCEGCLVVKARKLKPNIAIKMCDECVRQYLCKECDDAAHRGHDTRHHQRRTLVLGAGVRKRIISRGDAVSFPYSLDEVKVKLKSRVYHGGQIIHREPSKLAKFRVGMSSISVHVQVLGARNLLVSDINDTSDPFVTAVYSGTKIGSTRVRPRDLNPQWDNETFVVPMDDSMSDPKYMQRSQRHLFKLEVYDYDWFSFNDFLGHVEIPRKKLYKMAIASKEKPICLPLTLREFHGIVGVVLGVDNKELYVKVSRAESLDKVHPFSLNNPYAKVYFGEKLLGSTPVMWNTLDPEWIHSNVFRVKINDVLEREREILLYMKDQASALTQQPVPGMTPDQFVSSNVFGASSSSVGEGPSAALAAQSSVESISKSTGSYHDSESQTKVKTISFEEKPKNIPKKDISELISMNLLDDSYLLLRVELYDFNTYLSHVHLGTARVNVSHLRKMLPMFPKTPIVEKETFVAQFSRRFVGESAKLSKKQRSQKFKSSKLAVDSMRSNGDQVSFQSSGVSSDDRNSARVSARYQFMSSFRSKPSEHSAGAASTADKSDGAQKHPSSPRESSTRQIAPIEFVTGSQNIEVAVAAGNGTGNGTGTGTGAAAAGGAGTGGGGGPSRGNQIDRNPSGNSPQVLGEQLGSSGKLVSRLASGKLARQISSAFFGRNKSGQPTSDIDDADGDNDDEIDHEELLETVYGARDDDEINTDEVLENIDKRVVDAHGIEITQNIAPQERKRVGGKVLKVAAYQDVMAKKLAKQKADERKARRSGTHVSGSGSSHQLGDGEGGDSGLMQRSQSEHSLSASKPLQSYANERSVTFKADADAVDPSSALKIGEGGFENSMLLDEPAAEDTFSQSGDVIEGPAGWRSYSADHLEYVDAAALGDPAYLDTEASVGQMQLGEHDEESVEQPDYPNADEFPGDSVDFAEGADVEYDEDFAPLPALANQHRPGHNQEVATTQDVFAEDGLVPLGFEKDQIEASDEEEDNDDDNSSGSSLSADERSKDPSVESLKKTVTLHVDHENAYLEEMDDEVTSSFSS